METRANLERIAITLDGRAEITFTADRETVQELEAMKGKELALTIKPYSPKRSLTQNAYMWVLIGDLSKALKISKEEVYRAYIRDYGQYVVLPIKDEAIEQYCRIWQARGLGWVCEPLKPCKTDGYTYIICYYGTSSYNSKEMSALIDAVVADCQEQGISTMSAEDFKNLRNEND